MRFPRDTARRPSVGQLAERVESCWIREVADDVVTRDPDDRSGRGGGDAPKSAQRADLTLLQIEQFHRAADVGHPSKGAIWRRAWAQTVSC